MPQGVNIPVNLQVNNAGLAQQLLQTDQAAQKAAAGIKAAMKAATSAPDPQLQSILNALNKYQPHQIAPAFGPAMAQNLAIYQQRQAQSQKAAQNNSPMPAYNGPTPGAGRTNAAPAHMNGLYTTMAMAGTGQFRQIGTSMAMGFIAALTNTTGTNYGVGTRLLGALGVGPAAPSFGGSALGLLGGIAKAGPLGVLGGFGALGIGAVLAASGSQAEKYRQASLLSASVGGVGGGGFSARQMAFATAGHYQYDPSTGAEVAQTLGLLGAPAAGMFDPSHRGGTLGAVFAASRQSQLDPQTIAQYFGAQMGAGGQSLTSVIKSFRTLEEQSAKTKIPLDRLIEETQRFGQATGGAVPNMQALAGIQSVLGPGISAGGLIAPLSNATGADAYRAAAILHVSVGKLQQMQFGGPDHKGNQAELLDLLSSETKKITAGKNPAQAKTLAETFLNNTGLLDTSSLSAYKYSSLIDTMIYGSSKQFQNAASGIGKDMKFSSTEDWENQMLGASQDQTDILTQLEVDLKKLATDFGNFMPDVNRLVGFAGQIAGFVGGMWASWPWGHKTTTSNADGSKTTKLPDGSTVVETSYTGNHGIPQPAYVSHITGPGRHPVTITYLGKKGNPAASRKAFSQFDVVPNVSGSQNRMPAWMWPMIVQAAQAQGMDPFLLAAQVSQESGFNPLAKNGNHFGLGQFLPSTAKQVAGELGMKGKVDLFNPQTNLALMARYDMDLYNQNHQSWGAALNAYGTGAGVLSVDVNLNGKLEVVDSSGKRVGYVDVSKANTQAAPGTIRVPKASRHPAPNPHGGGHHPQ